MVIVHDEYPGPFKASNVYVTIRASVAWFLLAQRLAAERTQGATVGRQGRRIVHSQARTGKIAQVDTPYEARDRHRVAVAPCGASKGDAGRLLAPQEEGADRFPWSAIAR